MNQVVQNYRTGELKVEEVPLPALRSGGLLVRNEYSLISPGTERTKIETARSNIFKKAKQRPDLVKQVYRNMKQEGFVPTFQKVMTRLNTPVSLGYCSAGVVMEVGRNVKDFNVGDRVVCVGEGYACHAEVISVPEGFCVKAPDGVGLDLAAFGPMGAIAMQGLRQAGVVLGSRVAVIGLGLVGQLTVQLLKAAGCRVVGIDIDGEKLELAGRLGIDVAINRKDESLETAVSVFSSGEGVDAVIVAASTSSSDPLELAGLICREKGKVVLVGAVPIEFPRKEYYEKELDFVVSRAFGPGSYDNDYINGGDYPFGYVRWTARRNTGEFLHMIGGNLVDVRSLVTHSFEIEDAEKAYGMVHNPEGLMLGVLFKYKGQPDTSPRVALCEKKPPLRKGALSIGFVGAGNFAQSHLLPNLKRFDNVVLRGVSTNRAISANNVGRKYSFQYSTCDYKEVLGDRETDCVFIATRHDLHGPLTIEALRQGKAVFVEKPLAINSEELQCVVEAYQNSERPFVMVGFNRRFSPHGRKAAEILAERAGPLVMHYRVNAGPLPKGHWLYHPLEGGGRVVGEVCHFIDFLQFMASSRPVRVYAVSAGTASMGEVENLHITVTFADGSIGNITYTANGDPSLPREHVEIFGDGKVIVIDNFKKFSLVSGGKIKKAALRNPDMGHSSEVTAMINALASGDPSPIPFADIVAATMATFCINDSIVTGMPVEIGLEVHDG